MEDYDKGAVEAFNKGGIIIFPTDTAFGIGCRIDSEQAVDRLFEIRKRPLSKATPVLVDSIDKALAYYLQPFNIVRRLMHDYWPGALTIVAPCKTDLIYSPIRGGGKTIGLRMPNNQTIIQIIKAVGVPILGPSANFHGDPTPYSLTDLNPELMKLVDYVVPGVCSVGQASTVVDCSVEPYTIIRQGAVTVV
ncbi:MAG TPA: L-threonylcarbamoyladenylate synthase [Patescibacteria group bacterium]|nr:L-threonylcarbamoyladenylate synthase [Patescibacteria group bacterium]